MVDRLVQPAIEIDEGAGIPQPADKLLTRDQFARLFEQGEQELGRLLTQRNLVSGPSQLGSLGIEREVAKTIESTAIDRVSHWSDPGGLGGKSTIALGRHGRCHFPTA